MPAVPYTPKGRRTFAVLCLPTSQQCLCSSIPEQPPQGAAAPQGPLARQMWRFHRTAQLCFCALEHGSFLQGEAMAH